VSPPEVCSEVALTLWGLQSFSFPWALLWAFLLGCAPPESSLLSASKRETVGQTLLQKAQLGDPKGSSAARQKSPQEPRKVPR